MAFSQTQDRHSSRCSAGLQAPHRSRGMPDSPCQGVVGQVQDVELLQAALIPGWQGPSQLVASQEEAVELAHAPTGPSSTPLPRQGARQHVVRHRPATQHSSRCLSEAAYVTLCGRQHCPRELGRSSVLTGQSAMLLMLSGRKHAAAARTPWPASPG